MIFKFEFLNFHVGHLTQLEMINITFKCHKKKNVKKFTFFTTTRHGFWLLFFTLTQFSYASLDENEKILISFNN